MPQRSRPYNSPVRSRQAEATREAILTAARRLFAEVGYQATTMEGIAAAAEVSVPTVYATFKSKQGILAALVRGAVGDPGIRRQAAQVDAETDPLRRLRRAAHVVRLANEAESELLDVLWQAGSGNAELLEAWRQMHANRHARLSTVFGPILSKASSRRFVDIAWALASPEIYRLLVDERGWTPRQFDEWLGDSLVALYQQR